MAKRITREAAETACLADLRQQLGREPTKEELAKAVADYVRGWRDADLGPFFGSRPAYCNAAKNDRVQPETDVPAISSVLPTTNRRRTIFVYRALLGGQDTPHRPRRSV